MLPDPSALLADVPRVRDALQDAGWSHDALVELLGPGHREHLDRDELAPLLRRTTGDAPLARLARALVLGTDDATEVLPASWVGPDGRAHLRLQQVAHAGVEVVVPHDPGSAASSVEQEQVLGVGAASLTLAAATPRDVVGSVLDLGTGAGIQALLAEDHAGRVVATDRNPRAVVLTRLAAAINGVEVDAREGDLLQPVAGELFDLVVTNPPYVISPGRRYTYRDGGYEGDALCREVVRGIPDVLAPGGHAVLLANWLHVTGEDGDERVRSWFRGLGVDAWVVQRELAEPQDYVTAWLRDTDESQYDALYGPWVDSLTGVDAVAFGIVAMHRRTDGLHPLVELDEVLHPIAPTWGEEVVDHFRRRGLLEGDLLSSCLRLRDDVRLHQVATRGEEGWELHSQLLQQEAGLRWSGGVDEYGATLLAACDGTRPLGALVEVLALSAGLGVGEATEQVLPVVRALVSQGFLTG